jgi:hypothetical protein
LNCFFSVSIFNSIASQNPKDWEFSLDHLSNDPIQLSQPSTSRRRIQDDVETSKRRVQPRLDLNPQQLPLISWKNLQPNTRALVIILKAEAMLNEGHQVMFKWCFQNTNEGQMVSCLSDEVSHHLWFQGPLNHLGNERRASYIVVILCKILVFFAFSC